MTIRAVIFDMDGVLVDAKELHYEALNQALHLFGFTISRSKHLARYDGLPTRTKLDMLSQETALPRSLHGFINRMKQCYTVRLARAHLSPNAEHIHALRKLRQDGLVVGLASNSIRASIHDMIGLVGLSEYFSFMLSNEDVARPKPDPDIYLRALALARVRAEECLVIEDNPFGIQAARSAGTHVLPVSGVEDVTYERIHQAIEAAHRLPAPCRHAA